MARSEPGFRALRREDLPLLSRWLAEPHVEEWWRHDSSPAAVEVDFGPSLDGTDPTELSLVTIGERSIGLIQTYRIGDDPEWHQALSVVGASDDDVGVDYLIGEPDATGQGLGTAMIRGFVDRVWQRYPSSSAIVVAVQQHNPPSWRALEKVGFQRVWSGVIESDDPSDSGPSYIYRIARP